MSTAQVVALHMGGLHPYEKVLTLVLAFGPFVVLGVVIALRRREEPPEPAEPADRAATEAGPDRPTAP